MSSLNKVCLMGNLGKDPEVKSFQNGGRIATFSIATSEKWKDKNTGEAKEKTEWHNVTISNDGLVGVVERYLRKGSKVYLEGKLQTRKWQDQSGNDRYTTEVVLSGPQGVLKMLDGAPQNQSQNQQQGYGSAADNPLLNKPPAQAQQATSPFADDFEGDVPF